MIIKKSFGADGEAAKKFAEEVNGMVFCGKLGSLKAYMVRYTEEEPKKQKRGFGADGEAAKKFAEEVNGRVLCGKLGSLKAYTVEWK